MRGMTQAFVAIAIPSGDMVHTDFAIRLANMCANPGAQTFIANAKSSLVMLGRNQLVAAAQLAKATHILFLDTDMIFPHDTLARLLARDKDIIGGLYTQRAAPFHPLGVTFEGEHIPVTKSLRRMRIMPTGCLMIRMNVFDKLTKPYFNTRVEGEKLLGEDYAFCENATKAGFEIWCDGDLSVEMGHIGQAIYCLDNAMKP
jgi:hypothetical protein